MAGILVLGYGNPGRGDDGLGPALAEAIAQRDFEDVRVVTAFQLGVEDACALKDYGAAVFVDAAVEGPEPFFFREVGPGDPASFTSHSVSPAGLVGLARDLFGARTRAFVLGIRGYSFDEFGAPISPPAQANLEAALAFLGARLAAGGGAPALAQGAAVAPAG